MKLDRNAFILGDFRFYALDEAVKKKRKGNHRYKDKVGAYHLNEF